MNYENFKSVFLANFADNRCIGRFFEISLYFSDAQWFESYQKSSKKIKDRVLNWANILIILLNFNFLQTLDSTRRAGAKLIRQLSTRLIEPESKIENSVDDGIEEEGILDEEMLIDYKNTSFSKAKSVFETPTTSKSILSVVNNSLIDIPVKHLNLNDNLKLL